MKTVIVSGGFDPLHEGHVELLARAKMLGDRLVVLLNSDRWLMRKKGYAFMNFETRQAVLRALKPVDWVQGFDDVDGTCREGLHDIAFGPGPFSEFIFANGGDRGEENTPEMEWCNTYDVGMEFGVGGGKINSSSDLLKPFLSDKVERKWGTYEVLSSGKRWQVKCLRFNPGAVMNKQRHEGRKEVWTVVGGYGTLLCDGLCHTMSVDNTIKIMPGQWHEFHTGPFGCEVIETWIGECDEGDIERA